MHNSLTEFLATWFLIFVFYSVAGWVIEVLVNLVNHHKFINRGFLIGPLCPIYGVGALLLSFLCSNSDGIVEIICVSMVGGALLEYLTSWWMEMAFHVRWWDYTDQPFNLNGRICIGSVLCFGVAGVIILKIVNPLLLNFFSLFSPLVIEIIASIFLISILADIAISFYLIFVYKVTVDTAKRDATEEISEHIKNALTNKGRLKQHHYNAFPTQTPSTKTKSKVRPRSKSKAGDQAKKLPKSPK